MEDNLPAVIKKMEPVCPPAERVLCAVSGGADSVLLLHGLAACGYSRLIVCHFNHRARGRQSDADARFVQKLASRLGMDFVQGRSAAPGEKAEAEWREERYRFLFATARRRRCRFIFLGHNADDQAETVLWNLLRGAGLKGLAGMAAISEREGILLLRPFLGISKAALVAEAGRRGLPYREDSSNKDVRYSRNALRLKILPDIERALGRNVRERLAASAEIFRGEEEFLDGEASKAFHAASDGEGGLKTRVLGSLPVAIQRRVIRLWLEAGLGAGSGFDQIEGVRVLIATAEAAKETPWCFNLPGNHRARRRAGRLFIDQPRPGKARS